MLGSKTTVADSTYLTKICNSGAVQLANILVL